jgi:hypothetical protein
MYAMALVVGHVALTAVLESTLRAPLDDAARHGSLRGTTMFLDVTEPVVGVRPLGHRQAGLTVTTTGT